MTNKLFLLPLFCFALISCRDEGPTQQPMPLPQPERGVFIINEGTFTTAGSVGFYNVDSNTVTPNAIGSNAGWFFPNDARVVGKKLYVVVNGGDRIYVRNADTFQAIDSIVFAPRTGPGYLWIVDSTKAFVANYNGTISSVNLTTNRVTQTSGSLVAFPGGIVVSGGRIYVSDYGLFPNLKNIVKVIDLNSLAVLDSIRVGIAAGSMVGSATRVHVVCAGNFPARGKVYSINLTNNAVIDSITVGDGPSDIAMREQSLYVLHGERVMRLTTDPLSVRDSSFIRLTGGSFFYALNVAEISGDVYVSKVVSTGGAGEVEIYTTVGALKRAPFAVGIFPGAFAFKP
jgi:hypothetical protein